MSEPASIISTIAAVASAIGGAIACIAAFKSAGHAKAAFDENAKTEKRIALRQLSLTAHQVSIEVDRIKWLAQGLRSAYTTLSVFSGGANGSIMKLSGEELDKKLKEADSHFLKAKPFIEINNSLLNGPLDEIHSREVAMSQELRSVVALREKVEIELAEIQAQNSTHRELAITRNRGGHA